MFSASTIRAMAKRYNVEIVGTLRSKKAKIYYTQLIKIFIELDSEAEIEEPTYNYGAGYDLLNDRVFNKQIEAELNYYVKLCHQRIQVSSMDWVGKVFKIQMGFKQIGSVRFSFMKSKFYYRLSTDGYMVDRPVKENTVTAVVDALVNHYCSLDLAS